MALEGDPSEVAAGGAAGQVVAAQTGGSFSVEWRKRYTNIEDDRDKVAACGGT